MGLRDADRGMLLGIFAIFLAALAAFGAGVSVGRHYPAYSHEESISLENRLLDSCAGGKSISSHPICQIILATNSILQEAPLPSNESPSTRETEILEWLSEVVSDMSQGTCTTPKLNDLKTCPAPSMNRSTSQMKTPHKASPRSRTQKIISTIGTLSVYVWKFLLATTAYTFTHKVVNARILFALWACIPALWFFHYAPWYAVWTWYGLSTTATADLRWAIPVPRMVMFFYLSALMVVMILWYFFWNSREISIYVVLFLAVAVPLEPAMDFFYEAILRPFRDAYMNAVRDR